MAAEGFASMSGGKKLLTIALTILAMVLGAFGAKMLIDRFAGHEASFDRAVENEPNLAAVRVMRDRLPQDYATLRSQMLAQAEAERLVALLERHHRVTGSPRAATLLEDTERSLARFRRLAPRTVAAEREDVDEERLSASPAA